MPYMRTAEVPYFEILQVYKVGHHIDTQIQAHTHTQT